MPLPEERMEGKDELAAQASGKLPLMLLSLSAIMVSLGNAAAPPHAAGRVPPSALSVSVNSLRSAAAEA